MGNRGPAHRLFILEQVVVYTYALLLSFQIWCFWVPPYILSILIFDLTLHSPPKIHFRFAFFILVLFVYMGPR